MNEYFANKLKHSRIIDILPEEDLQNFLNDVETMSNLGVSSKEDEKLAMSIMFHVPDIINEIKDASYQLTKLDLNLLNKTLFENKSLLTTDNIFCAIAEAANSIGIPLSNPSEKECLAYPQSYNYTKPGIVYDVNKWMSATRDIVHKTNAQVAGTQKTYNQALDEVTANWNPNEVLSFKYWLRFYTDGSHNKYPKLANMKTAQYFGPNGIYLPQSELPQPERKAVNQDPVDTKAKIEALRSKIISRLSSAERLLASLDGVNFAGDEQEIMLKLLQDLKRKIQIMNRKNVYSSIFEDVVYRAGNFMKEAVGSDIGKKFFYKIAQMPDTDPFSQPSQPDTVLTNNSEDDTKQAFREFKELLEDGVYDDDDDPDEQKTETIVSPPAPALPAKAEDSTKNPDGSIPMPPVQAKTKYDITVFAQEIPVNTDFEIPIGVADVAPPQDKPHQQRERLPNTPEEIAPPELDLTVNEGDLNEEPENYDNSPEDDTDDVIESALQNITIHDAIARLEILVGIYKKREVPRQLSILDIMMNTLGLSSFFPDLGEAMAKALESSQYISTRLETVLNKLKGSVESQDADDWISKEQKLDPETVAIQKKLEDDAEKENKRREIRKQRANDRIDGQSKEENSTPIGEQSKSLDVPTNVETAKPLQVR